MKTRNRPIQTGGSNPHPELPSGWRMVKFGEMAHNVNERVDDPSKAGVDRYVGLEHLDPESLRIARWGQPTDVEATKLRFYPGDIIFGKRRFYQRKLAVADFEGICSAHALVLRAKEDVVLKDFLPFFMLSDQFFDRAMMISVGGLSPTINWSTLAKQEFALPPISEQRRIAEILWAAEKAVEACRQTAQRASAVTVVVAQTEMHLGAVNLISGAVQGRLPSNFTVLRGKDVFLATSGNGEPASFSERGDLLFFKVSDFNRNADETNLLTSESRFSAAARGTLTLFDRGTVVFPKRGAAIFLGKAGILRRQTALDPNVMALVPVREAVLPEYLYWLVKISRPFRFADTTSLPQLNHKHMNALHLPIPSLDVQSEILRRIGAARSTAGAARVQLEALRQVRSALARHVVRQ